MKYINVLSAYTLHSLPLFYQLRKMMSEMTIEVTFQIKAIRLIYRRGVMSHLHQSMFTINAMSLE